MYGLSANQLVGLCNTKSKDEKEKTLKNQLNALRQELAEERAYRAGYAALNNALEAALEAVNPNHPLLSDEDGSPREKIFEEAAASI